MITTEQPLAFPWYDKREKQHRFRANCNGIIDGLLCPTDVLLPFQIFVNQPSAPSISSWVINNIKSGAVTNLSAQASLISILSFNSGHVLVYNGGALSSSIACGIYESVITLSSGEIFYSELFNVIGYTVGTMPYMRITWANVCPISNVYYAPDGSLTIQTELGEDILTEDGNPFLIENEGDAQAFANVVYLDSFISHTEPELVEEIVKDGLGTEMVTFAKIINKLRFSEMVPDFLKYAFMAIPVHKIIYVLTKGSVHNIQVSRFRISSQAEDPGCDSFVDITIEIDQPFFQESCCQ